MGLFSKAPKPPDPKQQIADQTAANQAGAESTLRLNSLDRNNAFGGSAIFDRDETGLPTGQTVSFAPQLDQTSQGLQGSAAQLAGFLPQDQFSIANDVGTGDQVRDNFLSTSQALLAPGRERQQKALELRAEERGLPLGSEPRQGLFAPTNEANAFQDTQLAGQAIQLGGQEQNRLIQNALLERQQPGVDIAQSLGNLNQIPGAAFAPQPSQAVNPVNAAGINQQAFQNQSNQQQQNVGGLGSLLLGGAQLATAPIFGPAAAAPSILGRAFT